MCRRYPGPRCATALIDRVDKANHALEVARSGGDADQIRKAELRVAALDRAYSNTKHFEVSLLEKAEEVNSLISVAESEEEREDLIAHRDRLLFQAVGVANERLQSRSDARSVTGYREVGPPKREIAYSTLLSMYNAQRLLESGADSSRTVRGRRGNPTRLGEHVLPQDEFESRALANFLENPNIRTIDLPLNENGTVNVRDVAVRDAARNYQPGMEPEFTRPARDRAFSNVRGLGRVETVPAERGGNCKTTIVRVHDSSGIAHEAEVVSFTVRDGDGNYRNVVRYLGKSALLGNRAAHDDLVSSDPGRLSGLEGVPGWQFDEIDDEVFTSKRAATRARANKERSLSLEVEDHSGGRKNGTLALKIGNFGNRAITRAVRRGVTLTPVTMEDTQNYAQSARG